MKFTRPINREVDIDGNTFIVTLDDTGVGFRLKGKRKTAHAEWAKVFDVAQGEQGLTAREFLGLDEGESQRLNIAAEPERAGAIGESLSRAATAGEIGPES